MTDKKLTDVTDNNVGKMTDNEIIKALECCSNYNDCDKCNFEPKDNKKKTIGCCLEIMKNALDTITRQQAEIERLKECPKCVYEYDGEITEYCVQGPCSNFKTVEQVKSEAYKEFAERLKDRSDSRFDYSELVFEISEGDIDNLVKEMVGEDNAEEKE